MNEVKLLDCTFRDGGYYNSWDFDLEIVQNYLIAMDAISVDFVELGFRGFNKNGFKGAFAYTTDSFIKTLNIPENIKIGVMVNASEILRQSMEINEALSKLFSPADQSPVTLVRIACHVHEFEEILPASIWLKDKGYLVGYNIMQVAECSKEDLEKLASIANEYPLDVLYFADSLGSLNPEKTSEIINIIREGWSGALGIHTHDNMGNALANSLCALQDGVTWIDGTVTGMGRGPGNAKTEYLAIELENKRSVSVNIIPLMKLINEYFIPKQQEYGWGTNTFYYLTGKYAIHPTYVQEMLNDSRYNEEDIIGVIDYLKYEGGKKFSVNTLATSRNFYGDKPIGNWEPADILNSKEVLILGTGPSVSKHRQAIEDYIREKHPFVMALNTQSQINSQLIDVRVACHPVRLLADASVHLKLPQPLVAPISMLSEKIGEVYKEKEILDFGIAIKEDTIKFGDNFCVLPNSLVIGYAIAIAASGGATRILLAGFDGYGSEDQRTKEVNELFSRIIQLTETPDLLAVTPTQYKISSTSIYAL